MKKILIIGGAGYIGTGLTDHFLNAGHRVRSLDLFLYKNNQIRKKYGFAGYKLIKGKFNIKKTIKEHEKVYLNM